MPIPVARVPRKVLAKSALKAALAMWPIAISVRTYVAYIRAEVYVPTLFDILFDWTGLLVAGLWMLCEAFLALWRRGA